ncbi:MAG: YidC/Oxa1 family membrane protein insertase [Candidatus Komeilibacteria bacterium]|nr:YidC/Oxa1 family membrane protein insertase [Candidatus Komeilibacteria bacterium]
MLKTLYFSIFFQPIFNLLIGIYLLLGNNLVFAILALTIIIKLILWPINQQAIRSQRSMQEIQPKIEALKEKFKDDKTKLGQAMMELYKTEKVNPFSSCLTLVVQLPFLIAVYQVFRQGLSGDHANWLYSFMPPINSLQTVFWGWDLTKRSLILAVLAGLAQFWQTRMIMKMPKTTVSQKNDTMAMMNKQMLYFMPLITVWIGASVPSGLTWYWLAFTLLSAFQQYLVMKKKAKLTLLPQ